MYYAEEIFINMARSEVVVVNTSSTSSLSHITEDSLSESNGNLLLDAILMNPNIVKLMWRLLNNQTNASAQKAETKSYIQTDLKTYIGARRVYMLCDLSCI